jgi:hypothetical protein
LAIFSEKVNEREAMEFIGVNILGRGNENGRFGRDFGGDRLSTGKCTGILS